ncbi:hypothetical protein V8C86DRAFT_1032982 [Haematococcus lacustris]
MTSALKTTALLVLGAAISAKFAYGRVLLQGPSNQATAAAIFAPLPDLSANTTGSEPANQATVARIVALLPDEAANTTTINATSRDSDLTLDTYISEPFSTVRSCVPFTVLIAAPTKELADGYGTLDIDADKDVIDNLDASARACLSARLPSRLPITLKSVAVLADVRV